MLQRSQNGYSEEFEDHAFAESPFIIEHELYESEEPPLHESPPGEALTGPWEFSTPFLRSESTETGETEATAPEVAALPDAADAAGSTARRSAFSPEPSRLTTDEVAIIFGRAPAVAALHWLLSSPELHQATLAALLGGAERRSIRIHGSDMPVPYYLRLVSRLFHEAAEQSEALVEDATAGRAQTEAARAGMPSLSYEKQAGGDLRPYKAELQVAAEDLRRTLADPDPFIASVTNVAIARGVYDLMDDQLLRWPDAVLQNFDGKTDPIGGGRSEKYWRAACELIVRKDVQPLADPDNYRAWNQLHDDYMGLAIQKLNSWNDPPSRAEDRTTGIVYLYRPNQALMKKLMPIVADELMRWFNRHPITQDFLHWPAKKGFFAFLVDRPDIAAMLRLIDKQPPDVTAYEDPSIITVKTQTAAQTLVETAISFVPLVGDVVAAYEAFSAKDLFGNKLNSLDRGILGAAIFLPMMGMVVKDGRAVYSETRLVKLYGRTADEWSHAIDAVGRIEAKDLKVLAEAEEAMRLRKSLEPALARRAAAALPGLAKPAGLLQSSVDKVVSEAFATLRSALPDLRHPRRVRPAPHSREGAPPRPDQGPAPGGADRVTDRRLAG